MVHVGAGCNMGEECMSFFPINHYYFLKVFVWYVSKFYVLQFSNDNNMKWYWFELITKFYAVRQVITF